MTYIITWNRVDHVSIIYFFPGYEFHTSFRWHGEVCVYRSLNAHSCTTLFSFHFETINSPGSETDHLRYDSFPIFQVSIPIPPNTSSSAVLERLFQSLRPLICKCHKLNYRVKYITKNQQIGMNYKS